MLDGFAPPLKNLAWLQATCSDESLRDGKDAVRNAQRALELSEGHKKSWCRVLAAAHAEAGDFEQAVRNQQLAIDACAGDSNELEQVLSMFKAQRPVRGEVELPAYILE